MEDREEHNNLRFLSHRTSINAESLNGSEDDEHMAGGSVSTYAIVFESNSNPSKSQVVA